MRPDQAEKLNELSERLADLFITEADPDNWTAPDKLPSEMSKEERGNRHWDRKGAMGTGGVLRYTLDLISYHRGDRNNTPDEQAARDADLDRKIAHAEKKAKAAVDRVLKKASSTA